MEIYQIKNDIKVFCTTAKSFPQGIKDAFLTLEKMLSKEGRTFYGISYYSKECDIIYKAAVSENIEGEADILGFEKYTINNGAYLTKTILDWMNNIPAIGAAFKDLMNDERTVEKADCIEWYKSDKELVCMIKMKD